jgi:hypothetical protein
MINESITFDKLPQAVSYLTEQVIELKQMVSALQPTSSANNHILVEIDEAAIIIMKSKPTIYRLVNQGILPSYKKGKKLYFYGFTFCQLYMTLGIQNIVTFHS